MTSSTSWSSNTSSGYGFTIHITFAPVAEPPLPPDIVDAVWNAAAFLELDLPTNRDLINQARKRMARIHHPDAGGDLVMMQNINAAADFLLRCVR